MKTYPQYRHQLPREASSILLIRHGESVALEKNCRFALKDGHADPDLSPRGYAQAEAIGGYLGQFPPAAIYVTPLKRTHQSAAPLVKKCGIKTREIADLREVYLGEWEGGLSRIKAAEGDPLFEKICQDGEWGHIPGAETRYDFKKRVIKGLNNISKAHSGEEVAVFTHQGVIASALEWAAEARIFAFFNAANGSISRLIMGADYRYVQSFNETAHL